MKPPIEDFLVTVLPKLRQQVKLNIVKQEKIKNKIILL